MELAMRRAYPILAATSWRDTAVALLKQLIIATGLLAGLAVSGAIAQSSTLIRMKDLAPGEMRVEGFTLDESARLQIEAVGAEAGDGKSLIRRALVNFDLMSEDERPWQGNAWILDARTRRVVWELRASDTDTERGPVRSFDGTVRLGPGTYEVYYASYPESWRAQQYTRSEDRSWFERLRADDLHEKFSLTIEGEGRRLSRTELARAREEFSGNAVVSLTRVAASRSETQGFMLDRAMDLEVYAVGEARPDNMFDHGWIVNADTRERVWQMRFDDTEPAGGADKNRLERNRVRLPAGRYAAIFVTDDSHDPRQWNSPPPFDPSFYGLTLRVRNASDKQHVQLFEYETAPSGTPVVALTKLVDSDTKSAGFSLSRAADVRVYAIGEGSGNQMSDYGWIMDAETRERVWSMRRQDTEHAGGADKNRLVDRVIHLDPGNYIVYFVTDDSHSYEDWNAAPPLDSEHWGITIYPARDADRSAFASYDPRRDSRIIAELVGVRDDEHKQRRFSLSRDTEIRVQALGEGSGGEMYDYAWIEDARGRRVWTMRYDETEHAGGAEKNRMVSRVLRLEEGEYTLHYRTDDSHAFGAWNSDPPHDPSRWGVTLLQREPARRGPDSR
jgi:hypothetical protein